MFALAVFESICRRRRRGLCLRDRWFGVSVYMWERWTGALRALGVSEAKVKGVQGKVGALFLIPG